MKLPKLHTRRQISADSSLRKEKSFYWLLMLIMAQDKALVGIVMLGTVFLLLISVKLNDKWQERDKGTYLFP